MKNIHILPTDKPSNGYILGKCIKELSDVKIGQFTKTYYLMFDKEYFQPQNIYITNSEEIKEGEYCITKTNEVIRFKKSYTQGFLYKKIILTTDQSLIQDDVQAINDEFLEWFVKNPSCEEVEVIDFHTYFTQDVGNKGFYKIIIPNEEPITLGKIVPKERVIGLEEPKQKLHSMDDEVECNTCGNIMSLLEDESNYACFNSECTSCYEEYEKEPKQECKGSFKDCFKPLNECVCDNMNKETLEEAAERFVESKQFRTEEKDKSRRYCFVQGAKWQQERSYSEAIEFAEWIRIKDFQTTERDNWIGLELIHYTTKELFEQFKKK